MTVLGTALRFYLNGRVCDSAAAGTITGSAVSLTVGSNPSGNSLAGQIGLVSACFRRLPDDEIRTNFNAMCGRYGI